VSVPTSNLPERYPSAADFDATFGHCEETFREDAIYTRPSLRFRFLRNLLNLTIHGESGLKF
jgi:hypothetical protein